MIPERKLYSSSIFTFGTNRLLSAHFAEILLSLSRISLGITTERVIIPISWSRFLWQCFKFW
jgi:hypothetical protein